MVLVPLNEGIVVDQDLRLPERKTRIIKSSKF